MKFLEQAVANVMARQLTPQLLSIALAASESADQWARGQLLSNQAAAAIEKAVAEAINHVNLVIKNNPDKPLAEILARDDVQEALSIPFREAEAAVLDAVKAAWQQGQDSGWSTAVAELKGLGLTPGDRPVLDDSTLNSILQDVLGNTSTARVRFEEAFASPNRVHEVAKLGRDLINRAQLSVDAAGQSAHNEAKNTAFSAHEGVSKMWIAHIDEKTCRWCRWLHGQVVAIGEPFPTPAGSPKVYGGQPLYHPPRHPNCRCVVYPHLSDKVDEVKIQAGGLVDGATNDAPPPPTVTAEALRSIPKSKLKAVLAWLKKWLTGGSS